MTGGDWLDEIEARHIRWERQDWRNPTRDDLDAAYRLMTEDLPRLIDEVRRLRAGLEELRRDRCVPLGDDEVVASILRLRAGRIVRTDNRDG